MTTSTHVMASLNANVVSASGMANDGYTVDLSATFATVLGGRYFNNTHELFYYIRRFEQETGSFYSIRTSKSNEEGEKLFIKYQCHRKGFAMRPSEGKRRRTSQHTQCNAFFNVGRQGSRFHVTKFRMVHNHELLGNESSRWFVRNRRLTAEELEQVRPLLECRDRSFNLRFYVRSKFNKYLTNQDVANLRARHLFGRNNPGKLYFSIESHTFSFHLRNGTGIQYQRASTLFARRYEPCDTFYLFHIRYVIFVSSFS